MTSRCSLRTLQGLDVGNALVNVATRRTFAIIPDKVADLRELLTAGCCSCCSFEESSVFVAALPVSEVDLGLFQPDVLPGNQLLSSPLSFTWSRSIQRSASMAASW